MPNVKDPSPVGIRLAQARTFRKWSKYRLAKEMKDQRGGSLSWVGHVERGTIQIPNGEMLAKAAELLRVNLSWLVTGKGPMQTGKKAAA